MSANTFAQLLKVRHVPINQLHHCFRPVGSVVYRAGGCVDDRDGFTPPGASTMQLVLTDSSNSAQGIRAAILSSWPHTVRVSLRSAPNSQGYRNARSEQVRLPERAML